MSALIPSAALNRESSGKRKHRIGGVELFEVKSIRQAPGWIQEDRALSSVNSDTAKYHGIIPFSLSSFR